MRWSNHFVFLLCLGLLLVSPIARAFYDPFGNISTIAPSDELETRLWDESRKLRAQILRQEHLTGLRPATDRVRSLFEREFPGLSSVFIIHVYKESELAAITTPHGEIFISSGLLLRMEDDQELIALLVREMAHVANRDSARTLYYAKAGAAVKEVFSTALSIYNVASGVASVNSMANTITGINPDLLLSQLQITPEMLLKESGKMLVGSVKDQLKEDLSDFGRNLGGIMVHRLSVQAVSALLKTSLYGYSDRIERQADLFALSYLQKRYGNVDAFERLITRLLAQSQADGGLPFLSFYSNQIRLKARLQSVSDWRETHQIHPLAEQLNEIAALPKGVVVVEELTAPEIESEPNETTPEVLPLVTLDVSVAKPLDNLEEPSETQIRSEQETSDHSETQADIGEIPVDPDRVNPRNLVLDDPTLSAFIRDSLALEAEQGAPARFLANLDRLVEIEIVKLPDVMESKVKASINGRQPTPKQKAMDLLLTQIQSGEGGWKAHQLVGDLMVDLQSYETAITHYELAYEQASGAEYSPFLLDKKQRAEKMLQKQKAEK